MAFETPMFAFALPMHNEYLYSLNFFCFCFQSKEWSFPCKLTDSQKQWPICAKQNAPK